MKVYLVNDTSAFHCGSAAVCEVIRREVARRGHELSVERDKLVMERERIDACDAVLANGEGTLHDDTPRAVRILETLRFAQSLRKATALVNFSWFGMGHDHDDVLARLDACTVREALSRDLLADRHGVTASIAPDLSLFSAQTARSAATTRRVLTTDFYSREFGGFVKPTGGRLAQFAAIDMHAVDWQTMLDETAASELLATGRHHGVYAACKTRVPFIALPGNTPKIEGLIAWSGIALPLARAPGEILALIARARSHGAAFRDFFDWLHAQPEWRCPF